MNRFVPAVLLCLSLLEGSAAIYDFDDGEKKLRLNIPEGVAAVRGILIHGNGAGGDSTGRATDDELVAFARSIDFCVLATGFWGRFSREGEFSHFEEQIAAFATESGHTELVHAPWLPMGHSNGGQMSYGLNALRPEKVIAFITSKGCCYNDFSPGEAALRTPGLLISGELDTILRHENIMSLFDINRPRGALWSWVEEQGAGHSEHDSQQLKLAFLQECYHLRYPSDQSPTDGPVTLKNLSELDGWLVDQSTWKNGLTRIYPHDEAPDDPLTYGWVPNEYCASVYRAFSSYDKFSFDVSGSSGVTTAPTTLTYSIHFSDDTWETVEFFEGATKIGEATEGKTSATVTLSVSEGGFYVFHAIAHMADGSLRATHLRRVFVEGPARSTPYEKWALETLPPDLRDPDETLHQDGISNLMRFAFDLGIEPEPSLENLPRHVGKELIDGVPFHLFTYAPSAEALQGGVNFQPVLSKNLTDWTRLLNPQPPEQQAFIRRKGEKFTVAIPGNQSGFLSIMVDDRF